MGPLAVTLLLAFTLFPPPTLAHPVTPSVLNARQISSTKTGGDLAFDIAFSLALLITILGSFAWLATGGTVAQLIAIFKRMCAALVAVSERLSEFRLSYLVEKAAATIIDAADANIANTPRRGGTSYPMATLPWYRFQIGGVGSFGDTQGGGNPPDLASFT